MAEFLKSEEVLTPALSAPPAERVKALKAIDPCPYNIGIVIADCVFMFLGFVGLHATNSKAITRAAAGEIGKEVAKALPKWRTLINALKEAGSMKDRASAIWDIGVSAYTAGMFRGILAEIKASMK